MSSEEEAEVDGEEVFVIRTLPWQSEEVGKIKEALDQKWESMQSSRSRRLTLPRVKCEILNRPKHCEAPCAVSQVGADRRYDMKGIKKHTFDECTLCISYFAWSKCRLGL